ncbi:MAG: LysM peptidoglycan-binding domain-containing protein [Bacteroidota bacterium]
MSHAIAQKKKKDNQNALSPQEKGGPEANSMSPPAFQLKAGNMQNANQGVVQKQDEEPTAVSNRRRDGPYGWTSSYDVTTTDDEVQINIKVKISPQAGVTEEDVEFVKNETTLEFARYWDSRFTLTDDEGCERMLRASVEFVDSDEHLEVDLHPGDQRANLSTWYVDDGGTTRAHELGHQLGLLDEYVDARVPDRSTEAGAGVYSDDSLMRSHSADDADVRLRHGESIGQDISDATGTNYDVSWSDTYTVRKGDTLSDIAGRIYRDTSKWNEIYELNKDKIADPDKIYPGQKLTLPAR